MKRDINEFRRVIRKVLIFLDGKASRRDALTLCRSALDRNSKIPELNNFVANTSEDERYYWISNLYAQLMPEKRRKRLATFFTPPTLCLHVINRLIEEGLDLDQHTVIDPSSGGAAFLIPLAKHIRDDLRSKNAKPTDILRAIEKRLTGVEIEPGLSRLSEILLRDLLRHELKISKKKFRPAILQANTLHHRFDNHHHFDAVIGNPPYGRVYRPSNRLRMDYSEIITNGHVNLYTLFIYKALNIVRPGGLIGLIVPTSFISGPYFTDLRISILRRAHLIGIDIIQKRRDVFLDVLQDTCVLFIKRRKEGKFKPKNPRCKLIKNDGSWLDLGQIAIPDSPSSIPWVMPSEDQNTPYNSHFFSKQFPRLSDYGYEVRSGYFVWNREKERHREGYKPNKNEVPLIWAHTVRANRPCYPDTHKRSPNKTRFKSFVRFDQDSSSILRQPAIVLQRTTNRHQGRRLIAGYVSQKLIDHYGGYISENHTLLVYPAPGLKQIIPIEALCALLNSKPVDDRYRQISGSVNVSVKLLRQLPLPPLDTLMTKLKSGLDIDAAALESYAELTIGR